MGLDVAVGVVVLIAALRGWLRGFVSQAVRIAGFIACFYLADPVRVQARPYVHSRLPKVDPILMDRILWWVSAAAAYVVLVGVVTLLLKLLHRPDASGKVENRRDDRFAGFLLGAAKGALYSVFLLAGVQKYAPEFVGRFEWAAQMLAGSKTLEWSREYQPAPRIWESPPVRRFVENIQYHGLGKPTPRSTDPDESPDGQVAEARAPETSRPTPRLRIPESPTALDWIWIPRFWRIWSVSKRSGTPAADAFASPTGVDPRPRRITLPRTSRSRREIQEEGPAHEQGVGGRDREGPAGDSRVLVFHSDGAGAVPDPQGLSKS